MSRRWAGGVTLNGAVRRDAAADAAASLQPPAPQAMSEFVQEGIVVEDPIMKRVYQTVLRVAPASVHVLVLGETGVGKDVIATLLHEASPRKGKSMVRLNCASLPEHLLESELFGYERGAFTGAVVAKPGLLELAHQATLFLDEVGELPLTVQAKLLRVLESREVTRLGGVQPKTVDVRFVAATNRHLLQLVRSGQFRQDLYYRLHCVAVEVPPLRARPCEITMLAEQFLGKARARFGVPPIRLSESAYAALMAHPWPGNVRELKNVIERAVLLAGGSSIDARDLNLSEVGGISERDGGLPSGVSLETVVPSSLPPEPRPMHERERIARALGECGGNQSRAAQLLGIPRRTLVRRIAALGLPRPRRRG